MISEKDKLIRLEISRKLNQEELDWLNTKISEEIKI